VTRYWRAGRSDEFTRLLKRAGLPKIRLHDSRHTTLSLMDKADVPISIVSEWQGTTTPRVNGQVVVALAQLW
jgi:integrase